MKLLNRAQILCKIRFPDLVTVQPHHQTPLLHRENAEVIEVLSLWL